MTLQSRKTHSFTHNMHSDASGTSGSNPSLEEDVLVFHKNTKYLRKRKHPLHTGKIIIFCPPSRDFGGRFWSPDGTIPDRGGFLTTEGWKSPSVMPICPRMSRFIFDVFSVISICPPSGHGIFQTSQKGQNFSSRKSAHEAWKVRDGIIRNRKLGKILFSIKLSIIIKLLEYVHMVLQQCSPLIAYIATCGTQSNKVYMLLQIQSIMKAYVQLS